MVQCFIETKSSKVRNHLHLQRNCTVRFKRFHLDCVKKIVVDLENCLSAYQGYKKCLSELYLTHGDDICRWYVVLDTFGGQ